MKLRFNATSGLYGGSQPVFANGHHHLQGQNMSVLVPTPNLSGSSTNTAEESSISALSFGPSVGLSPAVNRGGVGDKNGSSAVTSTPKKPCDTAHRSRPTEDRNGNRCGLTDARSRSGVTPGGGARKDGSSTLKFSVSSILADDKLDSTKTSPSSSLDKSSLVGSPHNTPRECQDNVSYPSSIPVSLPSFTTPSRMYSHTRVTSDVIHTSVNSIDGPEVASSHPYMSPVGSRRQEFQHNSEFFPITSSITLNTSPPSSMTSSALSSTTPVLTSSSHPFSPPQNLLDLMMIKSQMMMQYSSGLSDTSGPPLGLPEWWHLSTPTSNPPSLPHSFNQQNLHHRFNTTGQPGTMFPTSGFPVGFHGGLYGPPHHHPFGLHPHHPSMLQFRNKPRRAMLRRAVFSDSQRKGLEQAFTKHAYITKPDRKELAEQLGLKDAQVKIWFQNRRMKWRNAKEREHIVQGQPPTSHDPSSTPHDESDEAMMPKHLSPSSTEWVRLHGDHHSESDSDLEEEDAECDLDIVDDVMAGARGRPYSLMETGGGVNFMDSKGSGVGQMLLVSTALDR